MEAKDTVMKEKDCIYQPDGCKEELWADIGAVYQGIYLEGCKTQAEISFKAGLAEGDKERYDIGVSDGKVEGIAEGMREVVEWIWEDGSLQFNDKAHVLLDKLLSQCKKWGI